LGLTLAAREAQAQEPSFERQLFEKQFPLADGGLIVVENPRGRILVKEGTPGVVRLAANGGSAPVLPDDLGIKAKGPELNIKCIAKDGLRVIDLYLTAPPGVRLKLKTEEGTVQVHARVRSVRAETISGDVVLNVPTNDLKIEVTWREGVVRYGGPDLQRHTLPTPSSSKRGSAPLPATLSGQIGEGRVPLTVATLNGWVDISHPTADRVIIGAAPAQPLSQAAQALARHRDTFLGSAIRAIEPRLESMLGDVDHSAPAPAPVEEDVVKLESPLVNLNVSVTDAEGKVISGLKAHDFTASEEGAKQHISHFAAESAPFNLVLLLDVSGSVAGKIELVQRAAMRFVDLMHPNDKLAVFLFARDVEVVAHLTSDRDRLRQAIAQVRPPHGSTALYDAVAYALVEGLDKVRGERNAVVVITDGQDSSLPYSGTPMANDPLRRPGSFLGFRDLLSGVLAADVLIYPIVVGNETAPTGALSEPARQRVEALARRGVEQLQQLADGSGGRLYRAAQIEGIESAYEQVAGDLRTIYSLAYMPSAPGCGGCWRQVAVTVARPGAQVRSRRGYLAR
jgi:Ca-activated chloride channel family protein